MNIKIICDYNENFGSKTDIGHINDHQSKDTFIQICNAIKKIGYNCDIFGGVEELIQAYSTNKKIDKDDIYINLSDGTDTCYSRVQIPVICDMLNLKYSGGGTFETALTTNKYYSALAVRDKGLYSPKSFLVTNFKDLNYIPIFDKYIIKPNSEGSSIGINSSSICNNKNAAKNQAKFLYKSFNEVLVEEYISGYDATCFVIGNDTILLNEPLIIKHHNKLFFENEAMGYSEHANKTRYFLPCNGIIENEVIQSIRKTSVTIKELFGIKDFCRIDYRITKNQEIYFLEINTVPAINMDSQVGVICNNLDISFENFLEKIITTILSRFNHV